MNVLVVGPHADDAEIMCGGTIALHRMRGDRVTVLVLSSEYLNAPSEMRKAEALEGAKRLRVNQICFGGLKDGSITDGSETVSLVDSFIEKTNADVIYTSSPKDRHQDHRNTGLAVQAAARRHTRVLACETSSVSQNFLPTLFVDISRTLADKLHAIEAHHSQNNGHSVVTSVVEATARFRGTEILVRYAEGFEPVRYLLW